MGSILIFTIIPPPSALMETFSLQHGIGHPEPVESTRRVDHFFQHFINAFGAIPLVDGSDSAQHLGSLVGDAGRRPETAAAGHIGFNAPDSAAAARGGTAADNALLQQTFFGGGFYPMGGG